MRYEVTLDNTKSSRFDFKIIRVKDRIQELTDEEKQEIVRHYVESDALSRDIQSEFEDFRHDWNARDIPLEDKFKNIPYYGLALEFGRDSNVTKIHGFDVSMGRLVKACSGISECWYHDDVLNELDITRPNPKLELVSCFETLEEMTGVPAVQLEKEFEILKEFFEDFYLDLIESLNIYLKKLIEDCSSEQYILERLELTEALEVRKEITYRVFLEETQNEEPEVLITVKCT